MCMEDVRIGRKTGSPYSQHVRVTDTTAVLLVPRNPKRYSLILSAGSGNYFVSPNRNMADTEGIRFTNSTTPVVLNVKDHGHLVTGDLYAIATSGPIQAHWLAVDLEQE